MLCFYQQSVYSCCIFILELLSLFVDQETLKQHYKNKLVGYILNGYLSLRKLVVQRTKLIDETQEKMLELLEELTTGRFCALISLGNNACLKHVLFHFLCHVANNVIGIVFQGRSRKQKSSCLCVCRL